MGRKARDLTGQRFGKLIALGKAERRNPHGHVYWQCSCDCGGTAEVTSRNLLSGNSTACGCGHGLTSKPEYSVWTTLRSRHELPSEWDNFTTFYHDLGERPSAKHVLSRRDATKPHCKENTYWRNRSDERKQRTSTTLGDFEHIFSIDLDQLRADARAAATNRTREAVSG